ncbi:MAG: D-Ala-D-Ala carboxypeptidase family metallohydrolase [Saccharospirillaceae bacterium]|jgi:uncharacterized protein YcbK (DUF882 family)|nr:D-Ala-D-Ala carboxypeptidase family metallohydrolase [Saccharospirillaceae bacterium]
MCDWHWKNFSRKELQCKETGECNMSPSFMDRLQALRIEFGKPMVITSAYRSRRHSAEKNKRRPGTHSLGCAVDVAVSGEDAIQLILLARVHGFTGIGVNQKGPRKERFIHLDDAAKQSWRPRPHIWSY